MWPYCTVHLTPLVMVAVSWRRPGARARGGDVEQLPIRDSQLPAHRLRCAATHGGGSRDRAAAPAGGSLACRSVSTPGETGYRHASDRERSADVGARWRAGKLQCLERNLHGRTLAASQTASSQHHFDTGFLGAHRADETLNSARKRCPRSGRVSLGLVFHPLFPLRRRARSQSSSATASRRSFRFLLSCGYFFFFFGARCPRFGGIE